MLSIEQGLCTACCREYVKCSSLLKIWLYLMLCLQFLLRCETFRQLKELSMSKLLEITLCDSAKGSLSFTRLNDISNKYL